MIYVWDLFLQTDFISATTTSLADSIFTYTRFLTHLPLDNMADNLANDIMKWIFMN